ncbi:hypothetical protein VQ056_23530 [Paenibacillus sp. JTLBN-2024]
MSVHGTANQLLRWGFTVFLPFRRFGSPAPREGKRCSRLPGTRLGRCCAVRRCWRFAASFRCRMPSCSPRTPGSAPAGPGLAGLVEYPNTFGLLMAAFLLERLFALAALLRREPGAGEIRLLRAALPLLPYCRRAAPQRVARRVAHGRCGRGRRSRPAAAAQLRAAAACGRALRRRGPAVPPAGSRRAGGTARPRPARAGRGVAGSLLAGLGLCRLARSGAASPPPPGLGGGLFAAAGMAAVFLTAQERIVRNFGRPRRARRDLPRCMGLFMQAPWFGQGGGDVAAVVPRRPVQSVRRQPGAQRLASTCC